MLLIIDRIFNIKNWLKSWPLTIAALVATVCIPLASGASAKPLMFIYIQGYNSCRRAELKPINEFLAVAANNPNSKMYWGCFDGGHLTHLHDTKEYFYLYSVDSKGTWSQGEEIDAQVASLQIAHYINGDLKKFTRASISAQESPETDVFIAGHSHGGWMAMRVAYQLSLMANATLRQLLTIDPVSYTLCSSQWFPANAIWNTFDWWSAPGDCHRAPRDLLQLNPTIAKGTNGQWINIYQNSMPYLTSGPIAEADKNIRYEPDTNMDWITAHRAIVHSDWTWAIFKDGLEALTPKKQ